MLPLLLLLLLLLCEAGYVCQYTEWTSARRRVSIPCKGRNCFRCVHTAVENESEEASHLLADVSMSTVRVVPSPQTARIDDRQMNAHVCFTWFRQRAAVTYGQPREAVGLHASSPSFDLAQAPSAALFCQSELYLKLTSMWLYLFILSFYTYVNKFCNDDWITLELDSFGLLLQQIIESRHVARTFRRALKLQL
jgi:hypothetical protein